MLSVLPTPVGAGLVVDKKILYDCVPVAVNKSADIVTVNVPALLLTVTDPPAPGLNLPALNE